MLVSTPVARLGKLAVQRLGFFAWVRKGMMLEYQVPLVAHLWSSYAVNQLNNNELRLHVEGKLE